MINKKLRVGIFGGTFNPPHIAHINVAKSFVEKAELDLLWVVPTNEPPHKSYSGNVSARDRYKMCEIAFARVPKSKISDAEISRGGKSYTVDTLQHYAQDDTDLYLLCGTDMFLSLDTWFMAERIFSLASICYVRRESDAELSLLIEEKKEKYINKYGAKIIEIPSEVQEISSTKIRERILSGDFSEIPAEVSEYIKERKLYL